MWTLSYFLLPWWKQRHPLISTETAPVVFLFQALWTTHLCQKHWRITISNNLAQFWTLNLSKSHWPQTSLRFVSCADCSRRALVKSDPCADDIIGNIQGCDWSECLLRSVCLLEQQPMKKKKSLLSLGKKVGIPNDYFVVFILRYCFRDCFQWSLHTVCPYDGSRYCNFQLKIW